jgi:hypothetical protein
MQKPKAMQVVMPDKDTTNVDKTKIRASEAMILILGGNDKIYYYYPIDSTEGAGPQIEVSNFKNIRKLIIDRNQLVHGIQKQHGWKDNGVYVLIKPTADSKYQNMVDMLDEMKITQIKSYAIVDITPGGNGSQIIFVESAFVCLINESLKTWMLRKFFNSRS